MADLVPPAASRRSRLAVFSILVLLGLFIALQAPALWAEWRALQREWHDEGRTRIIGYVDIDPAWSTAIKPDNWAHHEGDSLLLWSGWTPGIGHGWFRIGRGEIDPAHLAGVEPFGRDVIRAIDYPIVEDRHGRRWNLIWEKTPVLGLEVNGEARAYPLLVLEKVLVVNDQLGGRPVLLVLTPFVSPDQGLHVYDPTLEGRRLTLGTSGYFHQRRPLLYDRGAESFWVPTEENVVALTGTHKGKSLRRLDAPRFTTWAEWQAEHPGSPVLVGADRKKPRPEF
jgi:hypothetical protein